MQHLWEWPKEESAEHRPRSQDRKDTGGAVLSLQSSAARKRIRAARVASQGSAVSDEPASGHVELEMALDEIEIIYQTLEALITQLKEQGIKVE